MKPLLLGLLLLPGSAPAPPAARVTLTPLTQAAYVRARQVAPLAREVRTFPVRKRQGKIWVPTAGGSKLFRDKVGREETDNVTYTYLTQVAGYRPTWCKVWAKMNSAIFKAKPAAVTA